MNMLENNGLHSQPVNVLTCIGRVEINVQKPISEQKKMHVNQVSDREAVKDERRPAAWTGNMSPKVDMAAADLSLNIPTCPSVSIDPSLNVLSPNLLPTYNYKSIHFLKNSFHHSKC